IASEVFPAGQAEAEVKDGGGCDGRSPVAAPVHAVASQWGIVAGLSDVSAPTDEADLVIRRVGVAEVDAVIVVQRPVDAGGFGIVAGEIGDGQGIAVDERRPIAQPAGLWIEAGGFHRNGTQAIGGDTVARELIGDGSAPFGARS